MEKLRQYLTVKEAAKYLGVSPNTLRNWGENGRIPEHRNPINGYRLYRISDLDQFIRQVELSASRPRRRPK